MVRVRLRGELGLHRNEAIIDRYCSGRVWDSGLELWILCIGMGKLECLSLTSWSYGVMALWSYGVMVCFVLGIDSAKYIQRA